MTELIFSDQEMAEFLKVRGYKIALWPAKYSILTGPDENEKDTQIKVAIKKVDMEHIELLYWAEEIERTYGLKAQFSRQLKQALLKL